MNTDKPRVLLVDYISEASMSAYRASPAAQALELVGPRGPEVAALEELLPTSHFLLVRRRAITADMIAQASLLKAIVAVAGRVRIDQEALAKRGIKIEKLPRYTAMAVADLALGMMIALSRDLIRGHGGVASGAYRASGLVPKPTSETEVAFNWLALKDEGPLYGKRLGLIGLGEIGALVAARARAFGMTISYHQRTRLSAHDEQGFGVTYASLPILLAESDFVSIHVPDTPETRGLLSRANLERMKPGAYLVNTSRGHVLDEPALAELLAAGRVAGAGLDVFWDEPLPFDIPLARLPNVVLAPHIGGGGPKTLAVEMDKAFARIREVWEGA